MKHSSILLTLIAMVIPLNAQDTFGGPLAGYIFDGPGRAIRPVVGTPGAAYLGPLPTYRWDNASVSPNGKTALVTRRDTISLIPDIANQNRFVPVTRSVGAAETIVWSMDSSSAVLYSPASSRLQRLTGLNSSPALHTPVDVSFAGTLSGWSVSPDGGSVALASGASGHASVYLLVDDSLPAVSIGGFADPVACAFSSDGKSLFVFDRAVQRIVRIQIAGGAVQGSIDAGSVSGIQTLQPSPDGTQLYVGGSKSLSAFDLSTQQIVWSQSLDITADSVSALSTSPAIFILNYPRQSGSPVWLLDTRTAQVYFVPSGGTAGYASN